MSGTNLNFVPANNDNNNDPNVMWPLIGIGAAIAIITLGCYVWNRWGRQAVRGSELNVPLTGQTADAVRRNSSDGVVNTAVNVTIDGNR